MLRVHGGWGGGDNTKLGLLQESPQWSKNMQKKEAAIEAKNY